MILRSGRIRAAKRVKKKHKINYAYVCLRKKVESVMEACGLIIEYCLIDYFEKEFRRCIRVRSNNILPMSV